MPRQKGVKNPPPTESFQGYFIGVAQNSNEGKRGEKGGGGGGFASPIHAYNEKSSYKYQRSRGFSPSPLIIHSFLFSTFSNFLFSIEMRLERGRKIYVRRGDECLRVYADLPSPSEERGLAEV